MCMRNGYLQVAESASDMVKLTSVGGWLSTRYCKKNSAVGCRIMNNFAAPDISDVPSVPVITE